MTRYLAAGTAIGALVIYAVRPTIAGIALAGLYVVAWALVGFHRSLREPDQVVEGWGKRQRYMEWRGGRS